MVWSVILTGEETESERRESERRGNLIKDGRLSLLYFLFFFGPLAAYTPTQYAY